MEVVLVLLHVVVVLADARVILERARVSPQTTRGTPPPQSRTTRGISARFEAPVAVAREQSREALRVLVAEALEHALDAHGVEVPVGEVHRSRASAKAEIAARFENSSPSKHSIAIDSFARSGSGHRRRAIARASSMEGSARTRVADAVEVVRVENGRVRQARAAVRSRRCGAGEFV